MSAAAYKHIDIAKLRDLGFIQEANRLFFHPHGLALEVTVVTDDDVAAVTHVRLNDTEKATCEALIEAERERRDPEDSTQDLDQLVHRLETSARYGIGDAWLSGVWDFSDDPEGILFGDGSMGKAEKAASVASFRERYRAAREALFGGTDVEPVDYVWAEPTEAAS
jgi:hypothetical protein